MKREVQDVEFSSELDQSEVKVCHTFSLQRTLTTSHFSLKVISGIAVQRPTSHRHFLRHGGLYPTGRTSRQQLQWGHRTNFEAIFVMESSQSQIVFHPSNSQYSIYMPSCVRNPDTIFIVHNSNSSIFQSPSFFQFLYIVLRLVINTVRSEKCLPTSSTLLRSCCFWPLDMQLLDMIVFLYRIAPLRQPSANARQELRFRSPAPMLLLALQQKM